MRYGQGSSSESRGCGILGNAMNEPGCRRHRGHSGVELSRHENIRKGNVVRVHLCVPWGPGMIHRLATFVQTQITWEFHVDFMGPLRTDYADTSLLVYSVIPHIGYMSGTRYSPPRFPVSFVRMTFRRPAFDIGRSFSAQMVQGIRKCLSRMMPPIIQFPSACVIVVAAHT